jgi:FkbM family methyltransferase
MVSRLCALVALLALAAAIAAHIAGSEGLAESAATLAFAALFAAAIIPAEHTTPISTMLRRALRPLFGPEGPGARAILATLRAFYGPVMKLTIRGKPFSVDLEDTGVGFEILCTRAYEPAETAFFNRLLRPGDYVLDVGANIGYFTSLFAERVGPAGRVMAFEPDPRNVTLLRANVADRGIDGRVEVVHSAVGERSGSATLFAVSRGNRGDQRMYLADGGIAGGAPPRLPIEVPVVRIDDAAARWTRLDAVKMDIQGFEGHALAGMVETRARFPDAVMLVEFWPSGLRAAGTDPLALLTEFRRGAAVYEMNARGEMLALDGVEFVKALEESNRHINIVVGPAERLAALRR